MSDDYTPSTEEVLKYFSPPAHLTKAQRLGEGGGVLAHLVSLQNAHAKSVAEAAVRRWLVEHDRQVEIKGAIGQLRYAADMIEADLSNMGDTIPRAHVVKAIRLHMDELSTALQGVQEESKA